MDKNTKRIIRELEYKAGILKSSYPLNKEEFSKQPIWTDIKWYEFIIEAIARYTIKINDDSLSKFVAELIESEDSDWNNVLLAKAMVINHSKFKDIEDEQNY